MLGLDNAAPPGLRMSGRYAGASGFTVTFHPESVTIVCNDSERAYPYSVQKSANHIFLKIQNKANPMALQLKPDGSIFGEGTVQVDGRVIVGVNDDPKNRYVFKPKIGSCAVGRLVLGGGASANKTVSTPPAGAQPSAAAAPSPAPTPANGASPGASMAMLSIVSVFAAQPGVVNPLAGKTILVIKDSFENILAKPAGFSRDHPPGLSLPGPMLARSRALYVNKGLKRCVPTSSLLPSWMATEDSLLIRREPEAIT